MAKVKGYTPPQERDADCYQTHDIICNTDAKAAFRNGYWFSASSSAHVFDMRGNRGVMRNDLSDKEIRDMLEEVPADTEEALQEMVHTRIIFIDNVQDEPDRLQCTSELLQLIFQKYCISPRVARLLERQHMPGRVVQYDSITQEPTHHQFWYSAIIRSKKNYVCYDSSKSVLGWQRLCVWVGRNLRTRATIMLVLRCPNDIKTDLIASFSNKGEIVIREPMLLHTFFAQNLLQKAFEFTQSWADQIYNWEDNLDKAHGPAADFTTRSGAFLRLARQISQVATDYEILGPSLRHLKIEHEWISAQSHGGWLEKYNSTACIDASGLTDVWDVFLSECQLLRVYSKLYETRTQIAINQCFAMVNQRDAEINIKMAGESTQIARTSLEDGQSLRTIQVLTMIFLPASLFSGIFGMGFFNTDTDEGGKIRFSVSSNWWWYLALTIPVTVVTVLSLIARKVSEGWKSNKGTPSHSGEGGC